MSAIECLDLAKTLGDGERTAVLRGVTLRASAGRCVGLSGATGAGKTTLLRLIAGLETPDRGEIRFDEIVVSSPAYSVPPARRRIGFCFQSLGLWPHLDVEGHLDFTLAAAPFSPDDRGRRKSELLDAFHLRDLRRRRPAVLSGGEKHLLALARALAGDIRILLLDEPFAGLDGSLKRHVIETVHRMRRARGLTTLLISHDPADFKALCDEVIHLREGHVAAVHAPPSHARGSEGGGGARP